MTNFKSGGEGNDIYATNSGAFVQLIQNINVLYRNNDKDYLPPNLLIRYILIITGNPTVNEISRTNECLEKYVSSTDQIK